MVSAGPAGAERAGAASRTRGASRTMRLDGMRRAGDMAPPWREVGSFGMDAALAAFQVRYAVRPRIFPRAIGQSNGAVPAARPGLRFAARPSPAHNPPPWTG